VAALALVLGCTRPGPAAPQPPLPRPVIASYLAGKLAGYEADWGAAADRLADAAAAAPDQPMIAVALARAQIKARRADAALATLAAARAKWPRHPQVWLVSGDLLASRDRPAATAAYLRAAELQPDDERAYLGLAKLQDPAAAEATLRILIAHVPGSIEGHYRLAVRLAQRRELVASVRELRAVLERDPDHIDARLDLARALRRQGQLAQAIAETRSAFDRSGQALDIAEELFWVLVEADDRAAALDLLTLLDDDRSDADALAVLARLDRGLGRLAEARAIADRIAALDPSAGAIARAEVELAAGDTAAVSTALASQATEAARRLLAEALLAGDDPTTALTALGVPARAPATLDTALVAAFAYADLGRAADAYAVLAPFDPTTPSGPPRPAPASAATPADAAKPDDRKPTDRKPTDRKPTDRKPTDRKPTDRKPTDRKPTDRKPDDRKPDDRKPDGAKPTNAKPDAAQPEDANAGDAKPAAAPAEDKLDPEAQREAFVLARARLAERLADTPTALALLEPLIRERPDLVPALNLAGYLLADANQRLPDATRYLAHARELAPGDPSVLDSWGWLLLRRGEARAAVRALDHAARYAPLEPEILAHLAAAWAADGAPRTAAATLDRAEALRPGKRTARRIAAIRRALAATGVTMER
jgi:tetratricopeptide (TPR) repeat protein